MNLEKLVVSLLVGLNKSYCNIDGKIGWSHISKCLVGKNEWRERERDAGGALGLTKVSGAVINNSSRSGLIISN